MYYIKVIREEVYIRKPSKNFDLVEFIDEDNYLDIEVLENQFVDRSLLLVHTPKIVDRIGQFTTRAGKVISGGFTIIAKGVDKKYGLLSAHQVKLVLKELL